MPCVEHPLFPLSLERRLRTPPPPCCPARGGVCTISFGNRGGVVLPDSIRTRAVVLLIAVYSKDSLGRISISPTPREQCSGADQNLPFCVPYNECTAGPLANLTALITGDRSPHCCSINMLGTPLCMQEATRCDNEIPSTRESQPQAAEMGFKVAAVSKT